MDARFHTVLAEYNERHKAEYAGFAAMKSMDDFKPDELLLAVGPDTGALLHALVVGSKATRILEIGTSFGYSTLFLADAARQTGGHVTTLELAQHKQLFAKGKMEQAGLGDVVTFKNGDALDILKALDGPFDFVLLDLWKDLYVPCLDLFYPKLAPGALIAADNVIFPPMAQPEALAYRRAILAKPNMTSVLLPVGSGIELSRLKGPDDAL